MKSNKASSKLVKVCEVQITPAILARMKALKMNRRQYGAYLLSLADKDIQEAAEENNPKVNIDDNKVWSFDHDLGTLFMEDNGNLWFENGNKYPYQVTVQQSLQKFRVLYEVAPGHAGHCRYEEWLDLIVGKLGNPLKAEKEMELSSFVSAECKSTGKTPHQVIEELIKLTMEQDKPVEEVIPKGALARIRLAPESTRRGVVSRLHDMIHEINATLA